MISVWELCAKCDPRSQSDRGWLFQWKKKKGEKCSNLKTNHQLESISHNPEKVLTSLWCRKPFIVSVSTGTKVETQVLPTRGSAHSSLYQSCLTNPLGTHTVSQHWGECTVNIRLAFLVWWQSALGRKWSSRGPKRSPGERGKILSSGETICKPANSPQVHACTW